jgi:hypothetical protein
MPIDYSLRRDESNKTSDGTSLGYTSRREDSGGGWKAGRDIERNSEPKKIGKQPLSRVGEDGFGMELHALHFHLLVAQPHDEPVG